MTIETAFENLKHELMIKDKDIFELREKLYKRINDLNKTNAKLKDENIDLTHKVIMARMDSSQGKSDLEARVGNIETKMDKSDDGWRNTSSGPPPKDGAIIEVKTSAGTYHKMKWLNTLTGLQWLSGADVKSKFVNSIVKWRVADTPFSMDTAPEDGTVIKMFWKTIDFSAYWDGYVWRYDLAGHHVVDMEDVTGWKNI